MRASWAIPITLVALLAACDDRSASRPDAVVAGPGSIESAPLAERIAPLPGAPLFRSLSPGETGVAFTNRFEWEHPRKHLYQHGYAGGGVCVGDYDGDGRPDLYLVSQTGRDRLYRQVGDLRFEDATEAAGLGGGSEWGTGAVFADVDNDGDLDLFVCNYDAPNRLHVNQGDGTFIEAAAAWGVDFRGASVMGGFADYDRDGDLDLYLLTNRLYPGHGRDVPRTRQVDGKVAVAEGLEESFAIQERVIDGERGKYLIKAGQRDRLYRNNGDGTFTEVAAESGITGNHPGLSATWWDYDHDGWPDLYVGNDFWDADRLYHNERDGTFSDRLAERVPHTPWFSMGADFGDIDNDGRLDFLAADMSATSHYMSKIMMGDMNDSRWFLESAEPRQYMRNAMYLNTGTDRFMEVAWLTNLASTDWTWSVKFGDLDNDGRVDLFATNGTANHSFDPDLTRELRDLEAAQTRRRLLDPAQRWEEQWNLYRTRPPRRERNAAMWNRGDLHFEDRAEAWGLEKASISFGAAEADLDRDGDLDLVVSNIDDPVSIHRNQGATGHRLLLRLRGVRSNRFGIGAMVTAVTEADVHVRYLAPTRGYMSANEPIVHLGLGAAPRVETLTVEWPSGHVQRFDALAADRSYTITEPGGEPPARDERRAPRALFAEVAAARGLATPRRPERPYDDYERQPLLPGKLSQLGPGMAWGDADGDGDEDVFVGGSAGWPGILYLNAGDEGFVRGRAGPWVVDRQSEDLAPLWLDVDSDGDLDLFVASGSVECEPGHATLRDRLYLNDGHGKFAHAPPDALPGAADSAGAAVAADYDGDGDLDLFVGGRVVPGAYPLTPRSRLLRNDGGRFVDVTESAAPGLGAAGLVTGALFSDADADGRPDLLLTLEWGPVAFWRNTGGGFVDQTGPAGLAGRTGWWNGLTGADLDGDGDVDYVVTNAGLNTKYAASPDKPAYLYYGDFEGRGRRTLVEAKPDEARLVPVRGRSCSADAMPFVADRMRSYHDFASAALPEIYPPERLDQALRLEANHLESGVLINEGSAGGSVRFSYRPLPRLAQASPGFGVAATDLDGDGHVDVYLVQNLFTREPETGRWDGGVSLMLRGAGGGRLRPVAPRESGLVVSGDAVGLAVCDIDADGRPDLAVTRNDDQLLLFRNQVEGGDFIAIRLRGPAGNPTGVGAVVTAHHDGGGRRTAEVYAGSGHLSQSAPWLFFGRKAPPLGRITRVHVRWPDGTESEHDVAADAHRLRLAHPAAPSSIGTTMGSEIDATRSM